MLADFECEKCGHKEVDLMVKRDEKINCEYCGNVMCKLFPTGTSVIYKTVGFHRTDYTNRERQANGKRFNKKIEIKKG